MENEIKNLIQSIESSTKRVQETFGNLTEEQLNWKPGPEKWGVGECLVHLITTNRLYFPQFDKISNGEHENSLWQSVSPFSGFFGNFILKAVSPDTVKKMKTARIFTPSKSSVPLSVINEFVYVNNECIEYYRKFEKADLENTKVYSPVARLITYRLWAVLNILAQHEIRHINQAQRVMETEGFPKS